MDGLVKPVVQPLPSAVLDGKGRLRHGPQTGQRGPQLAMDTGARPAASSRSTMAAAASGTCSRQPSPPASSLARMAEADRYGPGSRLSWPAPTRGRASGSIPPPSAANARRYSTAKALLGCDRRWAAPPASPAWPNAL